MFKALLHRKTINGEDHYCQDPLIFFFFLRQTGPASSSAPVANSYLAARPGDMQSAIHLTIRPCVPPSARSSLIM